MASTEERLKILRMIQEGKITAEEGARLIDALEQRSPGLGRPAGPAPAAPRREARWFRVRVTDTNTGKTRVNVRLPVSLVSAGLKMGAHFSPEVEGLDVNQIQQWIDAGEMGQMADFYDEQDGERVEVFIE